MNSVALPNDGTPVSIGKVVGSSACIIMLYERDATGQSAILVSVGASITKLIGDYYAENNTTLKCYIDSSKNIMVAMTHNTPGRLYYKIIRGYY